MLGVKKLEEFLKKKFSYRKLLPLIRLKKAIFGHGIRSYSQAGEDVLLWGFFDRKKNGFFIDVGAHHPKRYSNTYLLYQNGWKGINIDPLPHMKKQFQRTRPRDINLNIGISSIEGKKLYYCFNDPAVNTFSPQFAEEILKKSSHFSLVDKIEVPVSPLKTILERYMPKEVREIDLLNIDVEGADYDVLTSNDFTRFRPKMILIEALGFHWKEAELPILSFMTNQEYEMVSWCGATLFFKDRCTKF